jgi:hypothetical protein
MAADPFVPVWPAAAEFLGLTGDQAYKQARTGHLLGLEVVRRGRKPMVARAALERLVQGGATPGCSLGRTPGAHSPRHRAIGSLWLPRGCGHPRGHAAPPHCQLP